MSERAKKWSIATIATVLSLTAGAASAVWTVAARDNAIQNRVNAAEQLSSDHESRLRSLEKEVGGIAADVRWIRTVIEKAVK